MFPTFPVGATLDSMLFALYRVSPFPSYMRATKKFFGKHVNRNPNLLARHLPELQKLVFKELVPARTLISDHSAWPVFSSLLSDEGARGLAGAVLDGVLRPERFYFPPARGGAWFTARWRACPACIADDQSVHGVGHWRVVHQLAGVHRCPAHDVALFDSCRGCGRSLGNADIDSLPGDTCRYCGSVETVASAVPASAGQAALANLYIELLAVKGPKLDPTARTALYRAVVETVYAGSTDRFREGLALHFGCSDEKGLSQQLEATVKAADVASALEGGIRACPATVQLAMAAHCLYRLPSAATGAEGLVEILDEAGPRRSPVAIAPSDRLRDQLIALAASSGIAPAAVMGRLDGRSMEDLAGQRILNVPAWRKFYNQLPDDLKALLPSHRTNWRKLANLGDEPSFEDLRDSHRERIIRTIREHGPGRVLVTKNASGAYRWCKENDRAWLDEVSPSASQYGSRRKKWPRKLSLPRGSAVEEARRVHRARLLHVALPSISRTELSLRAVMSYRWCAKHDTAWLDERFPGEIGHKAWAPHLLLEPGAGADEVRRIHRARLLHVAEPPTKRAELSKRAGASYQWCVAHDGTWLDKTFPRAIAKNNWPPQLRLKRGASLDEIRDVHRARVLHARTPPTAPTVAPLRASASYRWCLVHDKAWLEQTFPSASPRPRLRRAR